MTSQSTQPNGTRFVIRFESLFRPGAGMTFPCDEKGSVNMDSLPQRALNNYLFARAMIGREFSYPAVVVA